MFWFWILISSPSLISSMQNAKFAVSDAAAAPRPDARQRG